MKTVGATVLGGLWALNFVKMFKVPTSTRSIFGRSPHTSRTTALCFVYVFVYATFIFVYYILVLPRRKYKKCSIPLGMLKSFLMNDRNCEYFLETSLF